MKMIKDVKESILRFFLTGKFMYIIKNEYINHLVKMQKIVLIIVPDRFYKLSLEFIGIYIQNSFIGMFFFYKDTNSLSQMGFPETRISIYHEWIKSSSSRVISNSDACGSGQPVAFSFHIITKIIIRIEFRVEMN